MWWDLTTIEHLAKTNFSSAERVVENKMLNIGSIITLIQVCIFFRLIHK